MVAVLRLHHRTQIAGLLQSERGRLELGHHAAVSEEAQISSLAGRRGVDRVLLRELLEALGIALERLPQLVRTLLFADQDVARAERGRRVARLVLLVVRLDLLVGDRGHRLQLLHQLLNDEAPVHVLDLAPDVRIAVEPARDALLEEQLVEDVVLDEPLPTGLVHELPGPGWKALQLHHELVDGHDLVAVPGRDLSLGRRRRRRGHGLDRRGRGWLRRWGWGAFAGGQHGSQDDTDEQRDPFEHPVKILQNPR